MNTRSKVSCLYGAVYGCGAWLRLGAAYAGVARRIFHAWFGLGFSIFAFCDVSVLDSIFAETWRVDELGQARNGVAAFFNNGLDAMDIVSGAWRKRRRRGWGRGGGFCLGAVVAWQVA